MIKRLVLVASVCLSVLFTTNAIAEPYVSDSVKQGYLDWIKDTRQTTRTARFALAVAPNGAYGADWGYTIAQAKKKALRQCKKYAKSSPCEVVDVDGKSDFINTKIGSTSSTSTSTSSSSSKKGGSSELLSSGSFVAECEKNNELDVNYSGNRCDLEWNKLGESNRCKIKNSVMTFQTYDSGGQAKLNFSSGELKHGANTYKCSLSGDIKVVDKEDTSSSSSSSSSTISSSGQIWCLTKGSLSRSSQIHCETNSGQVITSSRAESFIGKGSVYCYYPKNNVWYWATGSCPAGEKEISKEEYYSLWCVAEGWTEVLQMDASKCDSNDGIVFATKPEAEIELKRLNQGSTSTTAKTAPDSAIELEFWKSIKNSNDPDMFQAYLDEYPNGKFAPLAKIKIKKLKSSGGDDK